MKRIAFLVISIYCFTACNNEAIENPETPTIGTMPRIELVMPDPVKVDVYSTPTQNENMIETIWVLVFDGSTKKWVEKISGSQIAQNGNASQLLPQLKHEPQPGWTIYCIANVDANPDTTTVTPSTINTCFKIIINGYYLADEYLPMYGEMVWLPSSGFTCVMKRAVAKIQVQMGTSVSDVTGNFSAENVKYRLHNGGMGGYIQPSPAIQGMPNIPSFTPEMFLLTQNQSATNQQSTIYLYEYPSSNTTGTGTAVSNTVFHADRQHITLHKANAPGDTTYYRLDFYNPLTTRFLDTERNHHYLFTIDKVRSEGYRTLGQAQANPGSNIEYTVSISDGATRVASNGQYAVVTSGGLDTLNIVGIPGSAITVVSARYQLPSQMTSLASGTRNDITVQTASGPTAFHTVSPGALTATNAPITVMVNAGTPSGTIGVLTFNLGNITHRVIFRFIV